MRYIPHTDQDIQDMCKVVGVDGPGELFKNIHRAFKNAQKLDLPSPLGERELYQHLKSLSELNDTVETKNAFLGAGAYHHFIPVAIGSIVSRGEFLTAYTPYQAEISQGTLQALFEFQTMIASLTGMDVANASMYDGASAVAEALLMALRVTRKKKILLSKTVHPEYLQILKTYLKQLDVEFEFLNFDSRGRVDETSLSEKLDDQTAAVCIQSPNFFGVIENVPPLATLAHQCGALFIASFTEALSLALLQAPGLMGADIVAGEGASFGISLNNGGPHLGLFSTLKKHVRQMPGRLVGQTQDEAGKRGYVLTLSTREQHIRRQKATSNICTNQGLCALTATVFLSLMGPCGLRKMAEMNFSHAQYLKSELIKIPGVKTAFSGPFFNEFVLELSRPVGPVLQQLRLENIFGGVDLEKFQMGLKNPLLVCATEMNSKQAIDHYVSIMKKIFA